MADKDLKGKKEGEGDEDGDKPEYVTKAELNTIIHKAVSAQMTRALKGMPTKDDLKSLLQEAMKPKDEVAEDDLEDDDEGDEPPVQAKGKKAPPAPAALDPAVRRQLKAQERAMKRYEADLAKERAERAAADEKAKRNEERAALQAALRANKISDTLLEAATALVLQEGRVKRDEDGAMLFRGPVEGGDEDDMPLLEGVKRWAASDAAKAFKAATGAQGGPSGKGTKRVAEQQRDPKKPVTMNELGRALLKQFEVMRSGVPSPGGEVVIGGDPTAIDTGGGGE